MNVPVRRIRLSRVVGVVLLLLAPMAGPGSLDIVMACIAAVTAYEILSRNVVYTAATTLLVIEIIYGLDVGILVLPYIASVCALLLMRRVMTLPPWTQAGGWHVSDALRVCIVACVLFALMTAAGVITGHYLYANADLGARLRMTFMKESMMWMPVVIAILLVTLRRIDEPFRRRITFGS